MLTELKLLAYEYDTIVIAGHSMGELVIRAAVICAVEDGLSAVLSAVRQIILFGTPNEGIMEAKHIPDFLSGQIADMDAASLFIRTLNNRWIQNGLVCPVNPHRIAV